MNGKPEKQSPYSVPDAKDMITIQRVVLMSKSSKTNDLVAIPSNPACPACGEEMYRNKYTKDWECLYCLHRLEKDVGD